MKCRFLVILILLVFILFETLPPLSAQENPPPSRASYWATGGESLIEEKQEIPFIEREALFQKLKAKNPVLFIDTREPHEYVKSHLPNAVNIPFLKIKEHEEKLPQNSPTTILIPYCNWDFRAYVAGLELKRQGYSNITMMYPHGLKGWEAGRLPLAGEAAGKTDRAAQTELDQILAKPFSIQTPESKTTESPQKGEVRRIEMHILKKKVEPRHIEASVGDHLILELHAEEEDHWFVIPDFGVNVRLKPGESKTIELDIKRAGYFPYGCITCCTRYQCQVKQAILVNLKLDPSFYGE